MTTKIQKIVDARRVKEEFYTDIFSTDLHHDIDRMQNILYWDNVYWSVTYIFTFLYLGFGRFR